MEEFGMENYVAKNSVDAKLVNSINYIETIVSAMKEEAIREDGRPNADALLSLLEVIKENVSSLETHIREQEERLINEASSPVR